jgi:hypothetical protein
LKRKLDYDDDEDQNTTDEEQQRMDTNWTQNQQAKLKNSPTVIGMGHTVRKYDVQ